MNKQIVFMFSGQGSQYFQMGKELYENHSQFRYWLDYCDEMVSPLIQASLIDVLYRGAGKSESFDRLLYSNPALFCIEYSLFKVLDEMGIKPDFLMGYSLGEITASVVSGAITLEDGIQLVVGVARLAEEKAQCAEMLVIMAKKAIMTQFLDLFHQCWLTGTNFENNFVVSGLSKDIKHLKEGLNKRDILSQILPVKYGFHTELIDPFADDFKILVRKINLLPIGIPIISSMKTELIQGFNEDYFWDVIRHPVDFEKTVEQMLLKGDYIFIDVGPSGSLATFVKYILPSNSQSIPLQMMNQFGKDLNSLDKLKTSLLVDVC